jgi:hypothetical protein
VGAGRGIVGAMGLGAGAAGLGGAITGLGAGAGAGLGAAAFGFAADFGFALRAADFLALPFLAAARFLPRAGAARLVFFVFLAFLAFDFLVFDFAFFAMIVLPIVAAQISIRLERTECADRGAPAPTVPAQRITRLPPRPPSESTKPRRTRPC